MYHARSHGHLAQANMPLDSRQQQPRMNSHSSAPPSFPMMDMPHPAYGGYPGQPTPSFTPQHQFLYAPAMMTASAGGQFVQPGMHYMNQPMGGFSQAFIPVPMHLMQNQFMYGSTPHLPTRQQHSEMVMMAAPPLQYGVPQAIGAKYRTIMSMRMGKCEPGLQSYSSVPDLSTTGVKSKFSHRNVSDHRQTEEGNTLRAEAHGGFPKTNSARYGYEMKRASSEWNITTAVISAPGVTTPHPTSAKHRSRISPRGIATIPEGGCGNGRSPSSSSSGVHSSGCVNQALDLDSTDPSLDEEVTIFEQDSPKSREDEYPKGDVADPLFKMPAMIFKRKGRHFNPNSRAGRR